MEAVGNRSPNISGRTVGKIRDARHREGGRVQASAEDLNRWLGRESTGEPVQVATESADLTSELKRGLSFVRTQTAARKKK